MSFLSEWHVAPIYVHVRNKTLCLLNQSMKRSIKTTRTCRAHRIRIICCLRVASLTLAEVCDMVSYIYVKVGRYVAYHRSCHQAAIRASYVRMYVRACAADRMYAGYSLLQTVRCNFSRQREPAAWLLTLCMYVGRRCRAAPLLPVRT